jgi:hypothetical protein
MRKITIGVLATMLGLAMSACSIDVQRNDDGSLKVFTTLTEESMQAEIDRALDDPAVQDLTVDLAEGHALVSVTRFEPSGATSVVEFRVDLAVVDGHLGAEISDAQWDALPVPGPIVARWNERIGSALERAGRRHPHATLVDVTISDTELDMQWHVATDHGAS